jgi:Protein of unknown function (DUF2842)
MRTEPTWRIPVGILGLLAVLAISTWPALAQMPVYIALGLVWLLPLRRFLIWMETGHWKR